MGPVVQIIKFKFIVQVHRLDQNFMAMLEFYTIRLILFVNCAIYTRDFLLHVSFVVSINISIHLATFWCVAHNRKQATKHQQWPADLAWIWRFF